MGGHLLPFTYNPLAQRESPRPVQSERERDTDAVAEDVPHDLHRAPSSLCHSLLVWLALCAAVLAGASIGPVFRYMMRRGVSPCLAAAWRSQAMFLSLSPLAVLEILRERAQGRAVRWFTRPADLVFPVVVHVLISGLAWAANLLFWVLGLRFVSTFAAALAATCHPLLLVLFLRVSGFCVSTEEWVGVAVAFTGTCLCNSAELWSRPESERESSSTARHVLGIALCMLSAAAEVVVIFNRIKIRRHVPLMQFTTATAFVVTLCSIFCAVVLEDSRVAVQQHGWELCANENCVFGWLSKDWLGKVIFFGVWVGVVVTTAFNYTMQYVPPLVISSLALLEPSLSAILSWLIGVESLPHLFSWIGGAVVAAGVVTISVGERRRRQVEKSLATAANTDVLDEEDEERDELVKDDEQYSLSDAADHVELIVK